MLGPDHPFSLEWVSVYTFRCQRMQQFRHGRVLFVGDSAHQVSPFGARGANSGIQDADNLVWKLALVLDGLAPDSLLDSFEADRVAAADENILNSTRSTDFITAKSKVSRAFRDGTLQLAERHEFVRTVQARTLESPEAQARWQKALGEIARSPAYPGLKLTPLLGLLPRLKEDLNLNIER